MNADKKTRESGKALIAGLRYRRESVKAKGRVRAADPPMHAEKTKPCRLLRFLDNVTRLTPRTVRIHRRLD
jgi:hypothetical protein